jgi:hypothetical protein
MIFQKLLIVSVGADMVTGKVEVMIRDILKEESLKRDVTPLSIRGEYDAVWCGC